MGTIFQSFQRLLKLFSPQKEEEIPFSDLFVRFQNILKQNNAAMELIADMGSKMGGDFVFDKKYLIDCVEELERILRNSAYDLNFMTKNKYLEIYEVIERFSKELKMELHGKMVFREAKKIYSLKEIEDEIEDIVGHKAYNLSRIVSLPDINVPDGFVVTLRGFREYMAYNDLFEKISSLIQAYQEQKKSAEQVSHAIRLMVLGGEIPPDLRRDILQAAAKACKGGHPESLFSVRSSAVGEDGELSFAGLYDSFLNVPMDELLSAFKKVLASLFNPGSLEYRRQMNLFQMEMAMPVLYQLMVPSRVAGVLYTLDPDKPEGSESVLSASWGLGKVVVEGASAADTFRVSRIPPHPLVDQTIQEKRWMLVPLERGPARPVPKDLQTSPCLTPQEAALIVKTGLVLERYFKKPLDIEWSLDDHGRLWVLQARPVKLSVKRSKRGQTLQKAVKGHHVLIKDRGIIAYRGVGAGPVFIASSTDDLSRFPTGAVLVSRHATPWLAKVIPQASAIVTDVGTITGHMATVAREFKVPTIVGTGIATQVLAPNKVVTVDAERNVIYEGYIEELLHHQFLEEPQFEITPEFQLLRRLLRKISPLYLTDPQDPNFTPKGCRTYHDIMRFMHEKAFQTLVQIGSDPRSFLRRGGKRLKTHIPLDLLIIDIGGGVAEKSSAETYITPDQITSVPMKAIWEGLSSPEAWNMEPIPVDFKGLMSSLTRTQGEEIMGNHLPGVNLAIIGSDYVNLSMPLGYHFTAVESLIGSSPENNYISFRFAGGVTELTRRSRRAVLLMKLLERANFKVQINGDLVTARAIDLTEEQLLDDLRLIGKLIGFTRQLDVMLKSDGDIDRYFEKFINQVEKENTRQVLEKRRDNDEKDDSLYS